MPLGVDFWSILMDFGSQVGVENANKINPKGYQKSNEILMGIGAPKNPILGRLGVTPGPATISDPPQRRDDASKTPPQMSPGPPIIKEYQPKTVK